jgi:UDPglucose--hexose-1-phosphate uridylyltransferase
MSELRNCPIKRRWTIIAPERKHRPQQFIMPGGPAKAADAVSGCPFEYGNEDHTLPEIFVIPRPVKAGSGPNWQVRVVPNRFPVLRVEGEVQRDGDGLHDMVSGVGAHELIIENPDHHRELADLELDELALVLVAWRERLVDLRRDQRLRYILIFKNYGTEAGASLSHPHCQLIATPIIPTVVVQELRSAREHFARKERCIFCDLIRQEQRLGERVAVESDRYVALQPFAAALPFETWILPTRHSHDLALATDDDLLGLASILRDVLRRLRVLLNDPPFNLVLHTSPSPHPRLAQPDYWSTIEHDFHWHIELVPRVTRSAGFEWGSGYTINPTPPEEAARFLKDTDPERDSNG